MLPEPTRCDTTPKEAEFEYEGADLDAIMEGVESFFQGRGYRLESGDPGDGKYGAGSALIRILFGGFAKRFLFYVRIDPSGDQRSEVFHLEKAMSGAMGGVIGHRKMTKEFEAIVDALSAGVP